MMSRFKTSLRVLNIESSVTDSDLVREKLSCIGRNVIVHRVDDHDLLRTMLAAKNWDLVICDVNALGLTALEALELVCTHDPCLPFVLFSEHIGEECVADMMKAGVEDIVLKSRPLRLIPVVKRILREREVREKEENTLRLANTAIAAKEQMLAIVSHDIKNPLSAIQLEAQMLLRAAKKCGRSSLSDEVYIQANRILKTTNRLKNLITDLLDKNKSENGLSQLNLSQVSARKLFEEVVEASLPLMEQKNVRLAQVLPEHEVLLNIDKNKMFQVFSNLLSNALKVTPEGGTIRLDLEETPGDLLISVSDTGSGLRPSELPKVFEKYWTGSSGTGLGLFICKTIVEAHRGRIMVENQATGGARFSFTVPKHINPLRDATFCFLDENKNPGKKVYVVDDDDDLRGVISWALNKEGYSIHSFSDPKAALESLRSSSRAPDLILVDYHMGEMMGGEFLELKQTIEAARSCPVVMISASPEEVELEVSRELYQQIITKPIDLEGLVSKVKQYTSSSMGFGISSYHTS
ncbi:MAG TPA: ATP-binding protein [Bacteriovoracaceae bacterium]|nr:ATP-binding protein [Bacteriovoracaceae bacterium]